MRPPAGATVMNAQGTNRFTPAFLAALASGIWSCCSAGPTQLTTTSIPASASVRWSSGAFRSHFRISTPRSCSCPMAGLRADLGRTSATTSCVVREIVNPCRRPRSISSGATHEVASLQKSVGNRPSGFTRSADQQNLCTRHGFRKQLT